MEQDRSSRLAAILAARYFKRYAVDAEGELAES
jgi:hypothetical protein